MDLLKPEYIIIGSIAPWIAQGIKLIAARSGNQINRKPITVNLFIVSMVLGYDWMQPAIPPYRRTLMIRLCLRLRL